MDTPPTPLERYVLIEWSLNDILKVEIEYSVRGNPQKPKMFSGLQYSEIYSQENFPMISSPAILTIIQAEERLCFLVKSFLFTRNFLSNNFFVWGHSH